MTTILFLFTKIKLFKKNLYYITKKIIKYSINLSPVIVFFLIRNIPIIKGLIANYIITLLFYLKKASEIINIYIIPYKLYYFYGLSIIVLITALFSIIFFTINFFIHLRYYYKNIKASFSKIKISFLNILKKEFYIKGFNDFGKMYSNFIYNFLVFLWDNLSFLSFVEDPYIIRDFFVNAKRQIDLVLSPFYNIALRFKNIFIKSQAKEKASEIIALMDEGNKIKKIEIIPVEVLKLFENDYERSPVMHIKWLELIDKVIKRWESGNFSGLLVSGLNGAGKSTILKYIENIYSKFETAYLELSRNIDPFSDEYYEKLLNMPLNNLDKIEKKIIIFDNIEYLFIRKIGGYERLKKFFLLVERTKSRILWIVSCNSVFKNYIKNIFPINSIFQFEMNFKELDEDFLVKMFERKLSMINYSYKVLPTKEVYNDVKKKINQKIISLNDVDLYIKKNFFKKCIEVGEYNINFHNFYFLNSIKTIKNKNILLNMPSFFEISFVNDLKLDYLFIICSLFIHKSLTKEELVDILLITPGNVSMGLSLLFEHNLIKKISRDEFIIHPNVSFQLYNYLRLKNLIK